MTHLATADEPDHPATLRQLALFDETTADLAGSKSIANSAGILGWPGSHGDVVRPGIMLYGVSPFIGGRATEHDLKPVMTFGSELIAVNRMKKGDAIGYGGTWQCPEDMTVGVVAAGYGDGYPRHARNGSPVLINGKRVPMAGRVSMDMLTVDLRSQPEAKIGDPVVLWGRGLPAEEVAEFAGTIAYELFCSVTPRVPFLVEGE
jgi:alanine racemase